MIKNKKELPEIYRDYDDGKIILFTDINNNLHIETKECGIAIEELKGLKWLFCFLAEILKAETEVKVWCEQCGGFSGIGYCGKCKGEGYKKQTFAKLS